MSNDDRHSSTPDVSAENPISERWVWLGPHRPPSPRLLVEHMTGNWGVVATPPDVHPAAVWSGERRIRAGQRFPDATLVIPTGPPKVRANDTDFRFRAGSDFFYLTGCTEPDCVLVIAPRPSGPRSILYIAPRRDQQTHDFFTDSRYGELWVGARRGVTEAAAYYEIDTAPLDYLEKDLASLNAADVLVLRGLDDRIDALVEQQPGDAQLAHALAEMRLVKDAFEVEQLELAIGYTVKGFTDVVRALPSALGRGERVIEGVFNLRARVEGNDVGYDTICASGSNATILHWTRNDGVVRHGDLLLLDAGVESHNLYTADVTRTLPISGSFTDAQRRIYELVLAAQEAGIAAVRPGASFMDPNTAAMKVLAQGLFDLGILSEEPASVLRPERQLHRRYTLHGVSHMLGLDVHDCANARNDVYHAELKEGYVLTIEPGLYFQPNDLTVPEEYRGIGVRIEDDVLVTSDGARNLSAALPRTADDVEDWMRAIWAAGVSDLGL